MKHSTNGMENVVLQVFTRLDQCYRKRRRKLRKAYKPVHWTVLQPLMFGKKNGKPPMVFEKRVLLGKPMMFQSPLQNLG